MKIAFIVDEFPAISETFLINQVADLLEKGIEIEVFAFKRGDKQNISKRYQECAMQEKTFYLDYPKEKIKRKILSIPKIMKLLFYDPKLLYNALTFIKYGRNAFSLRLIYLLEPFMGRKYDLFHCHFGNVANEFLTIKEIYGFKEKMVTSLYGYDVSLLFNEEPNDYYDKLKKESSLFFVMSNNMRERIIEKGFDKEKVVVLPVSIDVPSYPYLERTLRDSEPVKIISVGRLVEKKGFDDLLKALTIVKEKSRRAFECLIVGDGLLRDELFQLAERLNLDDVVKFKGYMKIEDIISCFMHKHLFVQPSKTAKNGDME